MNTYSIMQLPEEAMALVPPEILQVRFQDPELTLTQPGPKGLHCLQGSSVGSPTLPQRNDPETRSCPRRRRKHTE